MRVSTLRPWSRDALDQGRRHRPRARGRDRRRADPARHRASAGAALGSVRGQPHTGARGAAPARGARSRLVRAEPRRPRALDLAAELREAFLVRAQLEALATEVATAKMTPADLDGARGGGANVRRADPGAAAPGGAGRARRGVLRPSGCRATTPSTRSSTASPTMPLRGALAKAARRTFIGDRVWSARAELDELYARNELQHRAIPGPIAAGSATGARRARPRARARLGPADRGRAGSRPRAVLGGRTRRDLRPARPG